MDLYIDTLDRLGGRLRGNFERCSSDIDSKMSINYCLTLISHSFFEDIFNKPPKENDREVQHYKKMDVLECVFSNGEFSDPMNNLRQKGIIILYILNNFISLPIPNVVI